MRIPNWVKALVVTVILVAVGALGGYLAHLYDSATLVTVERDNARQLKGVSDVAAAAAQKYQAQQTKWQQQIAALDAAAEKDKDDAQEKENALRARLASGAQRVWVRATCPAVSSSDLSSYPGASGLDNGGSYAELDPATASHLAGIAADGDDAIRALTTLQAYVRIIAAPQK